MSRIDARELQEWMIFAELEPFGPVIDNLNFGTIASILYNSNKRKGAPAKSARDIAFGDFSDEIEAQKQTEIVRALKNFVSKHNKQEETKKRKRGKKKRG